MSAKSSIRALLTAAVMFARSVAPALFVSRKPRSAGPAFEPKESPSRLFKAPQRNADDEAIQRVQEKRARKASKRIRQAAGATK